MLIPIMFDCLCGWRIIENIFNFIHSLSVFLLLQYISTDPTRHADSDMSGSRKPHTLRIDASRATRGMLVLPILDVANSDVEARTRPVGSLVIGRRSAEPFAPYADLQMIDLVQLAGVVIRKYLVTTTKENNLQQTANRISACLATLELEPDGGSKRGSDRLSSLASPLASPLMSMASATAMASGSEY
jgi:hypothetical protein